MTRPTGAADVTGIPEFRLVKSYPGKHLLIRVLVVLTLALGTWYVGWRVPTREVVIESQPSEWTAPGSTGRP